MDPTKECLLRTLVTMLQCTTRGPLNSHIVLDMLDRIQIPKSPHLIFFSYDLLYSNVGWLFCTPAPPKIYEKACCEFFF